MTVGLTGYGLYRPDICVTAEEIAAQSELSREIITDKMGLTEKRVCPPDDDHVTDMCIKAGRRAIQDADIDPLDIDLVLYHGSEYKDYVVWSAAVSVAERLGADNAYATESHTLCASAPVAIQRTRTQLTAGNIETALHVTATRENDLVDYADTDASFMFNFGSGGGAYVLEADPPPERTRATVHESAATSDGSFAEDVIMPAGGSRNPTSHETVERGIHTLTVPNPDDMKAQMASVTERNFMATADEALDRSSYERSDVDFVALTHMKRSFSETLCENFDLELDSDSYYLSEYGHVQSTDQLLALDEGVRDGRVESGDVVIFLAAGTGYTWSATVLEWQG